MNTQMLHHHRTSSAYSYFTAGCLTPEHPLTNKIRSEATILLISGGEKGDGGHIVISCEKTTAVTLEGPQIIFFPPNACFCIKSERPTEYLSCHFNIENPALAQIDLQQLHRQHTEISTLKTKNYAGQSEEISYQTGKQLSETPGTACRTGHRI